VGTEEKKMLEDDQGRTLWVFETPSQGLLDIGAKLFLFETGIRIGIGTVIAQRDDEMLVACEFTTMPRLFDKDGNHFVIYGPISEAAKFGEGQ